MATVSIYPNGDGSKGSGWSDASSGTTNLYQSIDEGTASPNDSDFVSCNQTSSSIFFTLGDMPGDFDTLTSYEIKLRCNRSSNKGDYRYLTSCQLFKSDESTSIAGSHSISTTTTETTFTFSTTPSYTDKTSWDGARLKITMAGAGSTGSGRIQALQVDLVYDEVESGETYNETGSGGATAGGSSTRFAIYSVSSTGGALTGGEALVSDGNSEFASGGGSLGGTALVSRIFNKSTSGGAVAGGLATIALLKSFGGVVGGGSATLAHYLPCKGEIFITTFALFELITAAWSSIDEDFEVHLYTASEDSIETEADFTSWNFFIKEKEEFFVSIIEAGIVFLEAGVSPDYSIDWDEEEWGESVYILGYAVVGETSRQVYWANNHGLRIISATNSSSFNVRLPFRRQEVGA